MRTRREFLNLCAAIAGAANLNGQTGGYRALVCVFQFGGNDGNNMIVPTAGGAYETYRQGRGPLALAQRDLLPIEAQNTSYGLHPRLSGLRELYRQRRVAFAANVGMLVRPVTREQFRQAATAVPRNLFSHSDQVHQWQSSNPAGGSPTGWAGRIEDALPASEARLPLAISMAGNSLFLTGRKIFPATVNLSNSGGLAFTTGRGGEARRSAVQQILQLDTGARLVSAAQNVLATGLEQAEEIRQAASAAPELKQTFPDTGLGNQLRQVALLIASRSRIGAPRHVFFCSHGGYDNHIDLLPNQDRLLSELDPALTSFYRATEELGVASQVTTFTATEFGRTLNVSSTRGSDHGWGNHLLVMGGAVRGGEMYGEYPVLEIGGPSDVGGRGVWIPTMSLEQYGAALAAWYGVGAAEMGQVFPNLGNFAAPPALL